MISSTDSVPRDVHAGLEQLPTSFRRAKTGLAHNAMLKAVEQEGDTGNAMQLSLDSNGDLAHGRRVEMQHDAENSHHVESCSLRRGFGKTFTRSFLCALYQRRSIGCNLTAKPIRVQRRLNASPFCSSIPDLRVRVSPQAGGAAERSHPQPRMLSCYCATSLLLFQQMAERNG